MINILYIEDDPLVQRAVRRMLETYADAAVTVAGDAQTAIKFLDAALKLFGCFHYEHIICDFELYQSSGEDVLRWIQSQSAWTFHRDFDGRIKSTREALLERFTFLTSDERARTLHNRYVQKPVTSMILRKALATKGPLVILDEDTISD